MTVKSLPIIPKIPKPIKYAAEHGRLVIFVGSGVSKIYDNNYPTWEEFANNVVDELFVNQHINQEEHDDLIKLDTLPKLSLANHIMISKTAKRKYKNHFILPKNSANKSHCKNQENSQVYNILNSFKCSFVTTNYDKLLSPNHCHGTPERDWRLYNLNTIFNVELESYKVIHLHGCIDNENSMVITREDYISHYSNNKVQLFLNHLFKNKTMLILGYSLSEQEILEYILRNKEARAKDGNKIYLLQLYPPDQASLMKHLSSYYSKQFQIEPIFVEANYTHLETILAAWEKELHFGQVIPFHLIKIIEEELCTSDLDGSIYKRLFKCSKIDNFILNSMNDLRFFNYLNSKNCFSLINCPTTLKPHNNYWAPMDYLKACALTPQFKQKPSYAQKFLEIIRKIHQEMLETEYNPYISYSFLEILKYIPSNLITKKDIKILMYWLANTRLTYFPMEPAANWFITIATARRNFHKTFCNEIKSLLAINLIKGELLFKNDLNTYNLELFAEIAFTKLSTIIGPNFLRTLKGILNEAYSLALSKNLCFEIFAPYSLSFHTSQLCKAYSQTLNATKAVATKESPLSKYINKELNSNCSFDIFLNQFHQNHEQAIANFANPPASPLSPFENRILNCTPEELIKTLKSINKNFLSYEETLILGAYINKHKTSVVKNLSLFKELPIVFLRGFAEGLSYSIKSIPTNDLLNFGKNAIEVFTAILDINNPSNFWHMPEDEEANEDFNSKDTFICILSDFLADLSSALKHIADTEFYEKITTLLKIIIANQKTSKHSKNHDIISNIINGPWGLSMRLLLQITSFRGKTHIHQLEEYLSELLCKPNGPKHDLIVVVMLQYHSYRNWILSNLDEIFTKKDYLTWLCATSSYTISNFNIQETNERILNSPHFRKTLENNRLPVTLQENLISLITTLYMSNELDIWEFILKNQLLKMQDSYALPLLIVDIYNYLEACKLLNVNTQASPKIRNLYRDLLKHADKTNVSAQ